MANLFSGHLVLSTLSKTNSETVAEHARDKLIEEGYYVEVTKGISEKEEHYIIAGLGRMNMPNLARGEEIVRVGTCECSSYGETTAELDAFLSKLNVLIYFDQSLNQSGGVLASKFICYLPKRIADNLPQPGVELVSTVGPFSFDENTGVNFIHVHLQNGGCVYTPRMDDIRKHIPNPAVTRFLMYADQKAANKTVMGNYLKLVDFVTVLKDSYHGSYKDIAEMLRKFGYHTFIDYALAVSICPNSHQALYVFQVDTEPERPKFEAPSKSANIHLTEIDQKPSLDDYENLVEILDKLVLQNSKTFAGYPFSDHCKKIKGIRTRLANLVKELKGETT